MMKHRKNLRRPPKFSVFSVGGTRKLRRFHLYIALFAATSVSLFYSVRLSLDVSKYTDSSISKTFTNDQVRGRPVTFLWGIPTVDSIQERDRRQAVRETYLSYYKDDPDEDNRDRICSLADIQKKRVPLGKCRLAYVFFMGANPSGPTELVYPNASYPLLVDPLRIASAEDDVVYLNIKENLEDGKMQTWFKYASLVAEEDQFQFDYIAKVDVDTLLFTPAFLEFADRTLRSSPHNERSFGGMPLYRNNCNPELHEDHPCPLPLVGNVYFSGELYFMSPDLAKYISSSECNREAVVIRHEDVAIANYVFSHPLPVRTYQIGGDKILRKIKRPWGYDKNALSHRVNPYKGLYWAHAVSDDGGYFKDLNHYRDIWNQFQKYWKYGRDSCTFCFPWRMRW
jgi:hypothetical protein